MLDECGRCCTVMDGYVRWWMMLLDGLCCWMMFDSYDGRGCMMLDDDGCCWTMMGDDGCVWMVMMDDDVG